MRLVVYVRKSSDHGQKDSLETQANLCREYAVSHGHEVVATYTEETVSAAKRWLDQRREGARLIADIVDRRRPFDGVLVLAFDRLFRNPVDELAHMALFARCRCELISVREGKLDISTPEAELQHGMSALIRRYETQRTGQRVREHNLSLALSGQWPAGQASLGLTYDKAAKTLSVNDCAPDVCRVFEAYLGHGGNASAAARVLNAQGLVSRDGNPWRDDSVLYLVRSPIYRRRLRYDGREIDAPALIPEVVPPALVAQVDAILTVALRLHPRNRGSKHLYSGLLVCARCESRMKVIACGNVVWRCRASKESGLCPAGGVGDKKIDRAVGRAVQRLFRQLRCEVTSEAVKPPERVDRSAQERVRLARRRERLVGIHLAGAISQDEFLHRVQPLDLQLADLETRKPPPPVSPDDIAAFIKGLAAKWHDIPTAQRRELLMVIGTSIIVHAEDGWLEMETALPVKPMREDLE